MSTVADAAVGHTPGSASVSDSGEGSFSIPIFAPPGTHGMTPSLAFVYSHRNGSTLLGAGWSIGGLSAISRCPMIYASDGQVRNVRNDYSDRFCLDGNKLRLVSGTYGNAGAVYQTELETFSRITSYGVAGNGPTNFLVEGKDGLLYEYGNTADSRIESLGQSTVRTWALNQIRDRSGNAINFIYFEDTTNGAYRIDSVQYTSNAGQGLTSKYEVDFVWETKPTNEIDSGYIAGSLVKQVTRLDKVDVKYNTSTLVRRYELTYEGALSSTSKSRLASIQECAGSTPDCFAPTTFSYQNGTNGLNSEVSTGQSAVNTPWPMDVNGDGREDLVYSSSTTSGAGTWMVMFANASGGYNTPTSTGVTNTNFFGAIPIDYNADGLKDLLVPYSGGTWWVMLGSVSGLAAPFNTGTPVTGSGSDARAFDVNGDGLDDLVYAELVGYAGGDMVRYRPRDPNGSFATTPITLTGPMGVDVRIETGVFGPIGRPSPKLVPDLNGDGVGDFVYRRTTRVFNPETGQYQFFRALVAIGTSAWGFSTVNPNAAGTPTFGDFNGDGKSDVLYLSGTGQLVARFSTGSGLTGEALVGGGSAGWVVLDWDGDGNDDILVASGAVGGTWNLVRSTGESFVVAGSTGLPVNGQTVADVNGDGQYDLVGTAAYRTHAGNNPDLLLTATDGFGNSSTFSYAPLSTYVSYTKGTGAVFPMQEYTGPLYVITNVAATDGTGGTYNLQSFYYSYARIDLQGRGFLGFGYRSWIDSRDGTAQRRSYRQDFPYIGVQVAARRTQEPSGTIITEVLTTYSTHSYGSGFETRSYPFASTITANEREVGGTFNSALIRTTTQQNLVDSATGTPYDTTTTVSEPASGANGVQPGASYVERVYSPTASFASNPSTWCMGRPGQTQLINSHDQFGGGSITRTTDITWDTTATGCRPTQIVQEQGNSLLQVTRTLGYDGFGNLNSDSVTGSGMTARTTTANWGTTGQFPTSVTNALSQATSRTWNYAFGTPASQTDANGIAVSWQYDDFGRLVRENRPDGTAVTRTFNACAAPGYCGYSNLRYYIDTSLLNTAAAVVRNEWQFFDLMDRLRFEEPVVVTGTRVQTETQYDALGRVAKRSAPRFYVGTLYWNEFQYDLRNRVKQASQPTSDSNPALQTTFSYYEGLTTRIVDPLGKQSTKVANVAGGLARSIDHDGYYQSFDYDGFGNLVRVTDSVSNTLQSNTFNIRGMRTAQTDIYAGSWSFTPNALGEVTSQTDAKSQSSTFGYDLLGRVTSRVEPEGTSTFAFGTSAAAKNIGRLAGMSGPGYSEGFTYDSIGRVQQRSITSDATYTFDYAYNNQGLLDTLTYPVSTSSYRLKLQYEYQSGHLLRVKDFNAPTTVFWQVNSADPFGNVIDETLGNGVQTIRGFDLATGVIDYIQSGSGGSIQNLGYAWDGVGNLTQRQDLRLALTENFTYDNLHRVTGATGPDAFTVGYDPRGNITSRTGSVSASATHTITWYSYNLPNTLSASGNQSSQFFYAPDRSRWKQTASYAGTTEETIYVGGLLEKVTLGTAISWKHYIAGASGTVAIYTRKSSGTNDLHYLTKDHLDSVDSVTSSAGAVEVRLSFSALGQRRNAATWSGNPTSGDWTGITNTTRHGFTSHEMLDNLNLVHMNGRVYDQVVGQFTSPDPFIDGAGNTQGWNRYAYVHNNPLSLTDPSGFQSGADGERPHANWITLGDTNDFLWVLRREQMNWEPRPDFWTLSRGWGEGDTSFDFGDGPQVLPTLAIAFPAGTPKKGPGDTIGTAGAKRPSISESIANGERRIAELQALLDDVYEPPDIEPYTVWDGVADLVDVGGNLITAGEVLLGGASLLAVPTQAAKRKVVSGLASGAVKRVARIPNGPKFGELLDHAARHSTLHPNAYYNAAVRHLQVGTKFTFRHDGLFKNAFITKTGPDSFTFTSATKTGKRIFTHIEGVDAQYLRNLGITLPDGF
ncbi:MAG TPA: FG-GAP-like repeat-containing protein [Steroidobacteraceae bacterium]|nr:FG-GAP-like repeat-containing protein [Steroidobacteraceae bacterium]